MVTSIDLSLSWVAARAAKATGPSNPGSKEVPEGVADCLLGLSFVFTGELSSFSRDEAVDIAKRFGGYDSAISHPILRLIFTVIDVSLVNPQVKLTMSFLATMLARPNLQQSRSMVYIHSTKTSF